MTHQYLITWLLLLEVISLYRTLLIPGKKEMTRAAALLILYFSELFHRLNRTSFMQNNASHNMDTDACFSSGYWVHGKKNLLTLEYIYIFVESVLQFIFFRFTYSRPICNLMSDLYPQQAFIRNVLWLLYDMVHANSLYD